MVTAWVLYSLVTASLFAAAGWAWERLLAALNRPRRWAWAGSIAGAVLGAPLLVAGFQAAGSLAEQPVPDLSGSASTGGISDGLPLVDLPPAGEGDAVVTWLASLDGWILAAWLACALLYGLRLLGQWLRLRAESSTWRREEGVEIRVTDDRGPAAMGWASATIFVPRWFFELDDADRATVLEHEREHVRAGDHRLLLAATLLLGLAPWNPALRWSVRRLRDAVELDCDRRLVDDEADRVDYARLLLNSRSRMTGASASFTASASESCIQRRIQALLRYEDLHEDPPLKRALAVGSAATIACFGAALLTASHLHASGLLGMRLAGGNAGTGPMALADGVRCGKVPNAGHRTDVSVRLLRAADSQQAIILVGEDPALQREEGAVAGAIQAPSRTPCEVEGQALRFDIGLPALDEVVRLAVSPDARVGILDEQTGRTAAIHTPAAGEPSVRCAFGPGDRFVCRESGD